MHKVSLFISGKALFSTHKVWLYHSSKANFRLAVKYHFIAAIKKLYWEKRFTSIIKFFFPCINNEAKKCVNFAVMLHTENFYYFCKQQN